MAADLTTGDPRRFRQFVLLDLLFAAGGTLGVGLDGISRPLAVRASLSRGDSAPVLRSPSP